MSILVALDLIDEQPQLLPGYLSRSAFFDDQCSSERAVRQVLKKMAGHSQLVGVGGMGCNDGSAQAAKAAEDAAPVSGSARCS